MSLRSNPNSLVQLRQESLLRYTVEEEVQPLRCGIVLRLVRLRLGCSPLFSLGVERDGLASGGGKDGTRYYGG